MTTENRYERMFEMENDGISEKNIKEAMGSIISNIRDLEVLRAMLLPYMMKDPIQRSKAIKIFKRWEKDGGI